MSYFRNLCNYYKPNFFFQTPLITDYRIVQRFVVLAHAKSLRAAQNECNSASLSTQLLSVSHCPCVSEFHLSLQHVLPGPVECDCESPGEMWGRQATFSHFRLSKVYLYLFYHPSLPVCPTKYIHTYLLPGQHQQNQTMP